MAQTTDTGQSPETSTSPSSSQDNDKDRAKYVQYIGTAHVREIRRDQWEEVGVPDQETLIWSNANAWTIPASKISENAWPYIVADEGLVVTYDDKLPASMRKLAVPVNRDTMQADPNLPTSDSDEGVVERVEMPVIERDKPTGE